MAREISLTSNEWCNIIFEGKNQEYGAYTLRKESSKRHYTAFGMVALFALLLFLLPMLSKMFGIGQKQYIVSDDVILTVLNTPEKDKDPIKPHIEEETRPKVAPAIKFIAPVIRPDDEVKPADEIPSADELNNFQGMISSVNNVGEDINGVDPATVNLNNEIGGETAEDNEVHSTVTIEVQPSFPGGDAELMAFLSKNIKYPVVAQENYIQGKVQVQFVVGKDGSIEDVQIARGVDRSLDVEAMRVIKAMPKWIPGKQGGRAVKVKFYVPVVFKLQ